MSVLKARRGVSRAAFVHNAYEIYKGTIWFVSRMSARYSRILAADVCHLAFELVSLTQKANSMSSMDETRIELRKRYLIEAKASLTALDGQLSLIYQILMQNPQGAFDNNQDKSKALSRLDKMADGLGSAMDEELKLINGVLRYDKQVLAKLKKNSESATPKTAKEEKPTATAVKSQPQTLEEKIKEFSQNLPK